MIRTKFFPFHQNNSGGSFRTDDESGIGPRIWIEAKDAVHANSRAEGLGLYWDGVSAGLDCDCCGDRWYPTNEDDGLIAPEFSEQYDFTFHDTVYVHTTSGEIWRVMALTED